MKCPNCDGQLKEENYENMLINRCDKCSGIWLEYPELEQIEDKVWSDEELKGTLEFNPVTSTLHCPECNTLMVKFNYRYSDLILDTCPKMHGFWLANQDEEKKIKELMKEDMTDYERKIHVEKQWNRHLAFLQSATFMGKVKNLLNL